MILVHTMQGEDVFINPSMIETIRSTPDTVLFLSTNKRILVKDTPEEIVDRIVAYRQRVLERLLDPVQLTNILDTQDYDL